LSSSLPNMSNHFPSSVTRDSYKSFEKHSSRSPSRSRSASLSASLNLPPQTVREIYSDATVATEPVSVLVKPPSSYEPSSYHSSAGPVSSASTAAMALEKAQRERLRAERESEWERRKGDKGREKPEKEREKPEKEREKSERDRHRVDVDRTRTQPASAPGPHTPSSSHREALHRDSLHREPTKVYSNNAVPYDYSSHRSHGSRSGSSALRDSYNAHNYTTKAIPVLPTTKV